MECTTCSGIGFVLVERRQYQRKNVYRDANGYNCWPHLAKSVTRESFPTGRYHKVNEVCDDCHGSGLGLDPAHDPNCLRCHGTGEAVTSDGTGCIDFDPCNCENPAHRNPLERELLGIEAA